MGGNSYHSHGEGSASTYWRRRFIVLAIGLLVFGLAAWGLSNALAVKSVPASRAGQAGADQSTRTGPSSGSNSRDLQSSTSASSRSRDSSRSSSGSGGRDSGAPRDGRSDSGQSSPGTTGGGKSQHSRMGSGQAAGHGTILPAFCGRRDIVLSVFAGQTHFGPKDSATFELSIVSTQPTECTFNVGSAHLALVIKEGRTIIWNSADCPIGTPSLDTALGRGVPTVITVTWNRHTSSPGCSARSLRVPAGAYTAYAIDGTLTSQPISFRLT